MRHQISLKQEEELKKALDAIHIDLEDGPNGDKLVILNGEDVSEEIRQMHVSDFVSEVSAVPLVRETLLVQQRALGDRRNVVMDGRDIGTRVFPKANLKIFMTADPLVRAQRR